MFKTPVLKGDCLKKILLFGFLTGFITLRSETNPLPFITLNFSTGTGFYTTLNHEKIPDSHIRQPIYNPSFSVELGFKLSEKTQLFIGRNLSVHSYRIMNSHPQPYGFVSKDVSTTIWCTPLSLSNMVYNKNDTKLFFVCRLGFPKIITDVRYIYNDSIPPNNYTLRYRQDGSIDRSIMASVGAGIEHQLFIKEVFVMCHAEYILGSRFGSTNSVNRLCISAGLSFKVY